MDHLQVMDNELRNCGWHIKPRALLEFLGEDSSITNSQARDAVVAQLLDCDLKDVGSPSLPDAPSLQRITRLQGPLVLQVVSVRDICQSSSKSLLRTGHEHSAGGRLLRIHITDGCTVLSVIEYHSMPAFSVDVAPGTKVKLETSVSIQSGFLLGDARSFKILGGHVPALYESWEMERKYSGLARMTTIKAARAEDDGGPPPFHGLHVTRQGNYSSDKKPPVAHQGSHTMDSAARATVQQAEIADPVTTRGSKFVQGHLNAETSNRTAPECSSTSSCPASSSRQPDIRKDAEGAGTTLEKDVDIRKDAIKAALALGVEAAPLHNRAAAQKLLEKRAEMNSRYESGRGRGRGRGRRGARQQEEATFTLDEWEAKRGVSTPSSIRLANAYDDEAITYDDEALAQKLHYELNVENNARATAADAFGEAERIRQSMFSFAGANDDSGRGRHGGRGRGRGRGRRRG